MKLLGHTLGTPELDVPSALHLFSEVGLDGAEVIWQDGYRSGLPEGDFSAAEQARSIADSLGITIDCLTPYMTSINNLEPSERQRDIDRFRLCIQTAERIGVPFIRVYAGSFNPSEEDEEAYRRKRKLLVAALQELGGYAADHGVVLCVENHFGTMAVTARETAELMESVGSEGVGILYDQANLTFTHAEAYPEAIAVQRPWIRHVQAKDLVFIDPDKPFIANEVARVSAEERAVRSRVVGDGILDWEAIIEALLQVGYEGALSFEYEARWHPQDLPSPAEGFRLSAERVRAMLHKLERQAQQGTRTQ